MAPGYMAKPEFRNRHFSNLGRQLSQVAKDRVRKFGYGVRNRKKDLRRSWPRGTRAEPARHLVEEVSMEVTGWFWLVLVGIRKVVPV